jgi:hypothetical protein
MTRETNARHARKGPSNSTDDSGTAVNGETPRPFWALSFHFDDWELAGKAYEMSRDVIFSLDIDASAYRILLNARAHVVIVGLGLPTELLIERLQSACHRGEDSPLPDEVVLTLAIRHEQFATTPGTKVERRASL